MILSRPNDILCKLSVPLFSKQGKRRARHISVRSVICPTKPFHKINHRTIWFHGSKRRVIFLFYSNDAADAISLGCASFRPAGRFHVPVHKLFWFFCASKSWLTFLSGEGEEDRIWLLLRCFLVTSRSLDVGFHQVALRQRRGRQHAL
jgi:hypothetical protein